MDRGGPRCSSWAADALAGGAQPQPGITEWRFWPVWWWWRQLLVALGAGIGLMAGWWLYRRRHPRRAEPLDGTVDWWGGDTT